MPGRGRPSKAQCSKAKRANGTLTRRTATSPSRSTSSTENIPDSTSSTENIPNSTSLTENIPNSTSLTENIPNSTSLTENIPNSTSLTENIPNSTSLTENIPNSTSLTENIPNSTSLTENIPNSTSSTENIPNSTSSTENIPNSTSSAEKKQVAKKAETFPEVVKDEGNTLQNSRKKKCAQRSCSKAPSPEPRSTPAPRVTNRAKGARAKACVQSPTEDKDIINFNRTNGRKDKQVECVEQTESPLKEMTQDKRKKQLSLDDSKADGAKKAAETRSTLNATLAKLKIRTNEKSRVCGVINKIEKVILEHLRQTICFRQVEEPLHTGSYYEHLKISNPDEFDIMFPIPVRRIEINPLSEDGAFYVVALKRGEYNPLLKFQPEDKHLPASEILQEFRSEVLESIRSLPDVKHDDKKRGCPAVTLSIEVDSRVISLDIVLCLAVQSSWPPFTNDGLKIECWLGRKVKRDYKYKPYYLVAKYEGRGTVESNGIPAKDGWRISFSHIEKEIIQNHGSEKTCCEKDGTRCCRKDCLKLLKHLLSLLKEQDKSFDKFCSYHVKTTFLHACCSRTKDSEWAVADLTRCFEQLLKDFEGHLKRKQLNNFFTPTQNLLSGCSLKSCKSLAQCISEEREEGFPIFKS